MNNRSALFLALGLLSSAVPAFATHAYQSCKVSVDIGALTKVVGSTDPRVDMRIVYRDNLTDRPWIILEPTWRPGDGPWVYAKEIPNLPDRSLVGIEIVSAQLKSDGSPVWSLKIDRPGEEAAGKASTPIHCETYAD